MREGSAGLYTCQLYPQQQFGCSPFSSKRQTTCRKFVVVLIAVVRSCCFVVMIALEDEELGKTRPLADLRARLSISSLASGTCYTTIHRACVSLQQARQNNPRVMYCTVLAKAKKGKRGGDGNLISWMAFLGNSAKPKQALVVLSTAGT